MALDNRLFREYLLCTVLLILLCLSLSVATYITNFLRNETSLSGDDLAFLGLCSSVLDGKDSSRQTQGSKTAVSRIRKTLPRVRPTSVRRPISSLAKYQNTFCGHILHHMLNMSWPDLETLKFAQHHLIMDLVPFVTMGFLHVFLALSGSAIWLYVYTLCRYLQAFIYLFSDCTTIRAMFTGFSLLVGSGMCIHLLVVILLY
eukprot:904602_1